MLSYSCALSSPFVFVGTRLSFWLKLRISLFVVFLIWMNVHVEMIAIYEMWNIIDSAPNRPQANERHCPQWPYLTLTFTYKWKIKQLSLISITLLIVWFVFAKARTLHCPLHFAVHYLYEVNTHFNVIGYSQTAAKKNILKTISQE